MKQKKSKIAFVTPIYLPAPLFGSDMVVKLLAEEFANHGYDTSIITSNARTPLYWYDPLFSQKVTQSFEVINKVKVYRLSCNQIFSSVCYIMLKTIGSILPDSWRETLEVVYAGPALVGLREIFDREHYTVVHSSPFPLYLNKQAEDAVLSTNSGARMVLTPFFHTKVSVFKNKMLGDILRNVDVIHTVSEAEKKDIVRLHHISPARIVVVPLFLNLVDLHEREVLLKDVKSFKHAQNLDRRIVILFAGIKGAMKGAVDVLCAINSLYEKDKRYVLIAIGNNTKEWEQAKKSIDPNCLIDLGYKSGREKEVIFAACDIFCMPSKSDAFGMVYIEAWHKKRPVIAASIPATEELIGKNKGGILVSYGNHNELTAAIERLALDPILSKKLGINGYRSVKNIYTIDKLFVEYKKLFGV